MTTAYTAEATTTIHAPPAKIWKALTDPELIRQYLFGSQVITDWKEGSPIRYKGTWEGKPFEDKGQVVQVQPEKLLVVTHWSPLSGVSDSPENYHQVRYEIFPQNGKTALRIRQDNNATPEDTIQSEKNWQMVLDNLKGLLEQNGAE